jgi:hypothetical protein
MVRQVTQLSTSPRASGQIGPAAVWSKNLREHRILKAKFHEDCLERNMRTLSRVSKGCISSTLPKLLTAKLRAFRLTTIHPGCGAGVRFQVVSCSGGNEDK